MKNASFQGLSSFSHELDLPLEIQSIINNYPGRIQPLQCFIIAYFPDKNFCQAKSLLVEFAERLKGGTMHNGQMGVCFSSKHKRLIADDILIIRSFTDASTLAENLDYLIERVTHWGRVCGEETMAVEIGSLFGSVMLLISL